MSDDVLCPCDDCEDARVESVRDTELATLRAQLADAIKVVDAAMYFLASHGTANEEQDWRALSDAWIAYDQKQRAH